MPISTNSVCLTQSITGLDLRNFEKYVNIRSLFLVRHIIKEQNLKPLAKYSGRQAYVEEVLCTARVASFLPPHISSATAVNEDKTLGSLSNPWSVQLNDMMQ